MGKRYDLLGSLNSRYEIFFSEGQTYNERLSVSQGEDNTHSFRMQATDMIWSLLT